MHKETMSITKRNEIKEDTGGTNLPKHTVKISGGTEPMNAYLKS